MTRLLTLGEIKTAADNGAGVVMHTPLMRSETFTRMADREIWLKAENLQRTGPFKIRGAMNALAILGDAAAAHGVVAASQGNHAQGVAFAATALGVITGDVVPGWMVCLVEPSERDCGC